MKRFYDLYNDFFRIDLSQEEIDIELKEYYKKSDDKKQLLHCLNLYVIEIIDDYFNELKKMNIKIPFKFKNKYFIIKRIPHFNYKMIDIKANMAEELLLDMKKYVKEIDNIDYDTNDTINKNENSNISKVVPIVKKEKEDNKPQTIINNQQDITKYTSEIKNPLLYFDKVKLEVAQQQLDEDFELEVLKYIDTLKEEFIYLFKYSLNPNDDEQIVKMLISLDRLVEKKLENHGKQYVKKAS